MLPLAGHDNSFTPHHLATLKQNKQEEQTNRRKTAGKRPPGMMNIISLGGERHDHDQTKQSEKKCQE